VLHPDAISAGMVNSCPVETMSTIGGRSDCGARVGSAEALAADAASATAEATAARNLFMESSWVVFESKG
jgi:hypothetical protein